MLRIELKSPTHLLLIMTCINQVLEIFIKRYSNKIKCSYDDLILYYTDCFMHSVSVTALLTKIDYLTNQDIDHIFQLGLEMIVERITVEQ